jgi:hypothetical protein
MPEHVVDWLLSDGWAPPSASGAGSSRPVRSSSRSSAASATTPAIAATKLEPTSSTASCSTSTTTGRPARSAELRRPCQDGSIRHRPVVGWTCPRPPDHPCNGTFPAPGNQEAPARGTGAPALARCAPFGAPCRLNGPCSLRTFCAIPHPAREPLISDAGACVGGPARGRPCHVPRAPRSCLVVPPEPASAA